MFFTGQEQNGASAFIGPAQALHRYAGTQLFQYRGTGVAVVDGRFDDPRGYRVDTDGVSHEFLGQGPGQGRRRT